MQQKAVLEALKEEDHIESGREERKIVGVSESSVFTCARCAALPTCFVCHRETVEEKKEQGARADQGSLTRGTNGPETSNREDRPPDAAREPALADKGQHENDISRKLNGSGADETALPSHDTHAEVAIREAPQSSPDLEPLEDPPLLFRCSRCKLACHYEHRTSDTPRF